jgi:hypothetical protein
MLLCCFGFSEEGLRDKLVSVRSGFPYCLCGNWIFKNFINFFLLILFFSHVPAASWWPVFECH